MYKPSSPARPPVGTGTSTDPVPSLRTTVLPVLLYLGAVAVSLPVAVVLTMVMHPLWSWLDRTTGTESMGREGPAAWCYFTVWGVLALALVAPALWRACSRVARRGQRVV